MITAGESNLCGPVVSLGWITRQAEGQVVQLCSVDRAKIAEALVRPLPRNRCELVDNLAQYRVYHFRASRTLRVSYRPTEQGLCVIHVGKHSEFDRFSRHFAGQSPTNLIPLQESLVMKNYQHAGKNGATKTATTQANVQPSQQVAGEDEQLLVESLRAIISTVVGARHDALASDWAPRLDGVRKDVEQMAQECGRKIAQQDARLNGLANEYRGKMADLGRTADGVAKRQEELTASVAQARSDLEGRCEAQGRALEEIRAEVTRQAVQANVANNEAEHRLTALNGLMEERVQEFCARLDGAMETVESHEAAGKACMSRLDDRVSRVEQTLGSLDDVLNGLAATVQQQQETIGRLQETLSRLSAQVVELTTPATNMPSWRRLLGWVRGFQWTHA